MDMQQAWWIQKILLSAQWREILYEIHGFQRQHGYAPTPKQITERMGWQSPTTIYPYLSQLASAGLLDDIGYPRSYQLSPQALHLLRIHTGLGVEMTDHHLDIETLHQQLAYNRKVFQRLLEVIQNNSTTEAYRDNRGLIVHRAVIYLENDLYGKIVQALEQLALEDT